jgi:hypothetical protein
MSNFDEALIERQSRRNDRGSSSRFDMGEDEEGEGTSITISVAEKEREEISQSMLSNDRRHKEMCDYFNKKMEEILGSAGIRNNLFRKEEFKTLVKTVREEETEESSQSSRCHLEGQAQSLPESEEAEAKEKES